MRPIHDEPSVEEAAVKLCRVGNPYVPEQAGAELLVPSGTVGAQVLDEEGNAVEGARRRARGSGVGWIKGFDHCIDERRV